MGKRKKREERKVTPMDARMHGQEGALAPSHSGNVVKCFCAVVVMSKRSVDELFMHYFHNSSSASGVFVPTPLWAKSLDLAGELLSPNL